MFATLDERKIGELGTCENCKQSHKIGRFVKAVGFNQESRGNFFICFDCFRPRIYWKKSEMSITYFSPVELKKE